MDQKPEDEIRSADAAIQAALAALKRGDRAAARRLAEQAAGLAPESEAPWLILSALADPEASVVYALRALEANPESQRARQALSWAQSRLGTGPLAPKKPLAEQPLAEKPFAETPLAETPLAAAVPEEKQGEPIAPAGAGPAPEAAPAEETRPEEELETPPAQPMEEAAAPSLEAAGPEVEMAAEPETVVAEPAAAPAEAAPAEAGEAAAPAEALPEAGALPPEVVPPAVGAAAQPEAARIAPPEAAPAAPVPVEREKTAPRRLSLWLIVLIILIVIALVAAGIIFLPRLLQGQTLPADCSPSLVLGTHSFEVQTIKPAAGGTLALPASDTSHAYWVEGTQNNQVFLLSPLQANLDLANALNIDDPATFTQANCNKTNYSLITFVPGEMNMAALTDQSATQITVYIPPGTSSAALVIHGELQGQSITSFNTPDASELQVEVSLLDVKTSADKSTITVSVSINNTGQTAARLTAGDVSLTTEGAAPQSPVSTNPALPLEIKPGTAETVQLTFARPASATADLKIFTVEYTLDSY